MSSKSDQTFTGPTVMEGAATPRNDNGIEGGVDEVEHIANQEANDQGEDGVYIVIHSENWLESTKSKWTELPVYKMSVIQIVGGLFAILMQVLINIFSNNEYDLSTMQEGILAGVIYLTCGILGLVSLRCFSKGLLISFLVFNIFGSLLSLNLLVWVCCLIRDTDWAFYSSSSYSEERDKVTFGVLMMSLSIQLLTSLSQGVLAVTMASITCRTTCGSGSRTFDERFPKASAKALASLQVFTGGSIILLFILSIILDRTRTLFFEEVWCSLFFILTALVGFLLARRNTISNVAPFLVLNIIGSIMSIMLIVFLIIQIVITKRVHHQQIRHDRSDLSFYQHHYNCTEFIHEQISDDSSEEDDLNSHEDDLSMEINHCEKDRRDRIRGLKASIDARETTDYTTLMIIQIIQVVLAVTQLVVTLTSSGMSCRACCGCCECCCPTTYPDSTAVYVPKDKFTEGGGVIHVSKKAEKAKEGDRFAEEQDMAYKKLREHIY